RLGRSPMLRSVTLTCGALAAIVAASAAETPVLRYVPKHEELKYVSVGAARPLEDAARVAFKDMVRWVQEKTGVGEMDAYEFVSQNARAPIVEIVDPEYTVLVKIPKARLPR